MEEEILTCSICIEIFENPKMFPCQHSFCKDCLLSIIENKNKVSCPLCRKEILIDNGKTTEDLFPTNYLLSTLLELHMRKTDSRVVVTKQTTNKETQTIVKQQQRKRTRTIGTEMKRGKKANISTQTRCKETRVHDANIQTYESRLHETFNEEMQTEEAATNNDASDNVEIQTIEATTTCEEGNINNNTNIKTARRLIQYKNSFDFTLIINFVVVVIVKLQAVGYKVLNYPLKLTAAIVSFCANICRLARQSFHFISNQIICMAKRISFIYELFSKAHPLTLIKESIVSFYHIMVYFLSNMVFLCMILITFPIFFFPICFAEKMQFRPEIKVKRGKMKIIRSRHKIR
ncbi:RING finger protein nhl-1-like [Ruditapes philippinarum]|uniref:RING finger protein nhl-1-like n=1 Tax=Ruditapes philippinarum TaxID=129788 RepID=UPI00295B95B7|nr:RING finger protein nhl-1-like [Ruditapes philippinarum]XP_060607889.1 RING finger protein nhl-1-like [Ruditapes philippinarum]